MKPSRYDMQRCLAALLTLWMGSTFLCRAAEDNAGVTVKEVDGHVRVEIQGQLFTEYFYKEVPRPYLYPVLGVDNIPMTRNWPMKSVAGEEQDHVHHRSLWYAHGDVNGVDFWSDATNSGKIVHDGFLKLSSGQDSGVISARNRWMAPDGKCVMVDERNLRFSTLGSGRAVDFDITLKAENGEVTLGDTKEGTMALRLAESLRLKGKTATGHILNSAGVTDDKTWGKRAEWCDYSGEVNGHKVGVAIFDHSSNPKHPTWWHVRDYGLFAANPFGVHDFEKKEKGAGNLKIPAGQSLTFKYRFYFHRDGPAEAKVSEFYKQYIQTVNKP